MIEIPGLVLFFVTAGPVTRTDEDFSGLGSSEPRPCALMGRAVQGRRESRRTVTVMVRSAFGAIAALALCAGLGAGATVAQAADYAYGGYEERETVITRSTVVERRMVVRPERFVHEEIVERSVVHAPRRVVREVVEELPMPYRPRPVVRQVFIERDGFYGPVAGSGYVDTGFDPYD